MLNLKLAFRTLWKTPFITLVAVVSLALGIGANGAIFSLFDQVLLRSLPVETPDRLVNLGAPGPKPGSQSCNNAGDCDEVLSYPMFRDLEREQTVLTGLAAHRIFGANLAYKGQTKSGSGVLVSGSYFPTLGLRPALGRLLDRGDDPVVGEAHVVVLSHNYWRNRFGEDKNVLNDTLIVNGQSLTIVGVAPEGFHGTTLASRPEVFVPITLRGFMEPGFNGFENRRSYWAYVFGRRKDGVTLEEARTALNVPYQAILQEIEAPLQEGMSEATLERFRAKNLTVDEGYRGQSSVHKGARAPLLLLMSVVGVVLAIACANVANLLLARSATRGGEMAVRLSIGAGRWKLVSQLLVESCLLAVLGGVAGILAARWTLALIGQLIPPEVAATVELVLNWKIVGFCALLSLFTGILFGLFPALHATRLDLASVLKGEGAQRSGTRGAARFRTVLVTVQIALSTALLISAGLFTRSLWNISRIDLGLEVDHLVTFAISPELNGYEPQRSLALFVRAEEELRALPGVTGVTTSLVPLIAGSSWGSSVRVQGFEADPDTDTDARYTEVGPGYYRTLGTPLISGREFTDSDVKGAPKVAIVNEAFAEKFGLGRDAVGRFMSTGMSTGGRNEELDMEIVGLVQNAKYNEVKGKVPPVFVTPYRQDEQLGFINFYVRTALDPQELMAAVPDVVRRLDPNLPVEGLKTMPQQVRENVFMERMLTTLSASFAFLATLLAAVGLYGVLAFSVAQRTREIGLRMALGADAYRVRLMVLAQVGRMTLAGAVIGIGFAIGLGQLARSQLFDVKGYDPFAVVAGSLLLALVAFGSGFLPARRASAVDPMRALRYE